MTEQQKEFISGNKIILKEIFVEKVNLLKDSIFSNALDKEQRDAKIEAVKAIEKWLKEIDLLDNKTPLKFDEYK